MQIEGKVALVTGGAKGLGLAIASHLLTRGAVVIAADVDQEALTTLPEGIEPAEVNITDSRAVNALVDRIVTRHGRIDVLVNNAGAIHSEPMINIMRPDQMMHDLGRFRRCISANLESVFIVTAAVVEHMARRRLRGSIVNISSISARGNEGQTAYSAAKAGVNAMTVTWSKEFGRFGIRCNAVAPGFIDTPSTRAALSATNIKHIESNTPLRRLGTAEDVARAVASLIDNDFVNGTILDVNGGLVI
ncbi:MULTISPECIES: SDR family NAD(P)-dependent oxidoreductase [unclassified Bosea (in: a-proteobacteria)]|uniref:SDR family NAD(P)-dependent oxidoreductase n=1 Tax=unclassified Bosea (in: a-proteobacteria) TaxID=2653178 RepID=UPI00125EE914|nr:MULTISPECIES: SDR family NAD(P)-dependent oxidoreductase [unclassified Bosea (in: a-proteobacteria)]